MSTRRWPILFFSLLVCRLGRRRSTDHWNASGSCLIEAGVLSVLFWLCTNLPRPQFFFSSRLACFLQFASKCSLQCTEETGRNAGLPVTGSLTALTTPSVAKAGQRDVKTGRGWGGRSNRNPSQATASPPPSKGAGHWAARSLDQVVVTVTAVMTVAVSCVRVAKQVNCSVLRAHSGPLDPSGLVSRRRECRHAHPTGGPAWINVYSHAGQTPLVPGGLDLRPRPVCTLHWAPAEWLTIQAGR